MEFSDLLEALEEYGLLLQQDKALPSVVGLLVGSVKGSWWGHPESHRIFALTGELEDHPDVLVCKLVSGKTTFVHRRLWPALLAAALEASRDGLSEEEQALLGRVEREGTVRASGKAGRALQQRLLVLGRQVHTETGHHATQLRAWPEWAREVGVEPAKDGRALLEGVLAHLAGKGRLPWA